MDSENKDTQQTDQLEAPAPTSVQAEPVVEAHNVVTSNTLQDTSLHRRVLFSAVIIMLIVVVSGAIFFVIQGGSDDEVAQNDVVISEGTDETQSEATEIIDDSNDSSVTDAYLATYETEFLIPEDEAIHAAILVRRSNPDVELLTYRIGEKTDDLTPFGQVGVLQFQATPEFNPPADCGPWYPNGFEANEPLPCREVERNEKYVGYAYEGVTPGAVQYVNQDGSGPTILTLYAQIGETVVAMQGYDVEASTIISYMDAMVSMNASDFPSDTLRQDDQL